MIELRLRRLGHRFNVTCRKRKQCLKHKLTLSDVECLRYVQHLAIFVSYVFLLHVERIIL